MAENPGVLAASALRRIDDKRVFGQGDSCEPAGDDLDVAPVNDVRSEVDVAALHRAIAPGGRAGKGDDRLRDVVARIGDDELAELLDFGLGSGRAHQHAVAAGLVGGLDHQLGQVVEDVFLVVRHAGADRIGKRDVSSAVGVHQARHAEHRVFSKNGRVEEIIVDAAVDHVDPDQAGGGAHEDHVVDHHEVAAFHDLDAHLAGQV